MALGPLAKLSVKILKAASKKAKNTKVAKKATSKGKDVAKKSKKAVSAKAQSFKSKIKGALGVPAGASLGGLGASLLGQESAESRMGEGESLAASAPVGKPSSSNKLPAPKDDAMLDFSGVAAALMAAVPTLQGIGSESRDANTELASVIVRKDVMLDSIDISEDDDIPFIPAGTFMHTRIPEIAQLFSITDALRSDIDGVSSDLDGTNFYLKKIAAQLGIAINMNRKTAEKNERRRDEEEVENKEETPTNKSSFISDSLNNAKDLVKGGILVKAMKYSRAAAAIAAYSTLSLLTDDASASETEPTEDGVTTEADIPEEEILAEQGGAFDGIIDWIDKSESNADDKSIAQSVVGGALSDQATVLGGVGLAAGAAASIAGGIGAVGTAAVLAPIATAAAVATGGYIAGTVIYEQTGLKQGIESVIDDMIAGESIDLGSMTSEEAMKEKYEGKQGVELLGDLLGEGVFDLAESPAEIIAAFKDVDSMEKYQNLANEYQAKYQRPLTSALNDVLGTKGVESVFNLITQQALERIQRKSGVRPNTYTDARGGEWKISSIERPSSLRGGVIPSTTGETPTVPVSDTIPTLLEVQKIEYEVNTLREVQEREIEKLNSGGYRRGNRETQIKKQIASREKEIHVLEKQLTTMKEQRTLIGTRQTIVMSETISGEPVTRSPDISLDGVRQPPTPDLAISPDIDPSNTESVVIVKEAGRNTDFSENQIIAIDTNSTQAAQIFKEKVETVIEDKMPDISGEILEKATSIMPIVVPMQAKAAKAPIAQAGTQTRSQIESATSTYRTNDNFAITYMQT